MNNPKWSSDICPSRDDAQPHIYHQGLCVFCDAPLIKKSDALVRAQLRLRAAVTHDYHGGEQ